MALQLLRARYNLTMHSFTTSSQQLYSKVMWSPLLRRGSPSYNTAPMLTRQQNEMILYVESVGTLIYDLRRSDTTTSVIISFGSFFRTITGSSLTGGVLDIFGKFAEELSDSLPFWQSSIWIDVLDDFHQNLHRVRSSTLGRKLIQVINHLVAHSFYHKMGFKVNSELFDKIEKKKIEPTIWDVTTFADALVGLLLFLAKAGRQALLTGDANAFFVDSTTMSSWMLTASRLRKDAEFLGNPSAVGMETSTYLFDLNKAIEEGNLLKKVLNESSKTLINNVIVELEMVQKRYQCSLTSASFRFCPVGVFLWGDSAVGKSFISKGLFYHYCSVRGIPKEKAILYPRNSDDKYHSGYKSHMVGILFDDVAKHKANKVIGIDVSLTDIIATANNIASITNQGEVQDKGKIPMLSEWMGVSSNLPDLNVHSYFENTYAVLRRMPYRIQPIVKNEYCVEGTTRLDSKKVPAGLYPDCWTFRVCSVKKHDNNPLHGEYDENYVEYPDYASLLKFLTTFYQEHIDNQIRLMKTVNSVGPEPLCECLLPKSLCQCTEASLDIVTDCETPKMPTAQSAIEAEDIKKAALARRQIEKKYTADAGLAKQYYLRHVKARALRWFGNYCAGDKEETIEQFVEEIDAEMAQFDRCSTREKIIKISPSLNSWIEDDESYLTFEPKMGGPRCFMRSQLKNVHQAILKYVSFAKWNDKQLAALEVYLYEKVPQYLARGWDDDSILQGAFDYIDEHGDKFEENRETRDLLLSDLTKVSWYDWTCRKLGMWYFSYPWVFRSTNYIASTRIGSYIGRKMFMNSGVSKVQHAVDAAEHYNISLGGNNPIVVFLIVICSSTFVIGLVSMVFKKFMSSQGQGKLDKLGKLPTRRNEDKVNVWRTEERNLTSLDFHPKKPNSLAQMTPGLMHNCLVANIHAQGIAKATTRVIVINNETILMNYHCTFPKFTLTLFYGEQKEKGLNPKFSLEVERSMMSIIKERDLAIIHTEALPALFKDISRFFPKESFKHESRCHYFIPTTQGPQTVPVVGVVCQDFGGFQGSKGDISTHAYTGRPERPTVGGECGSPLVMQTSYGPVIVGIHCAYNHFGNLSHAVPVYYSDFEWKPMVQVGVIKPAVPLSQGHLENIVDDRPPKLYTDFHEDGQLVVFGMLQGFRPRPKANGGYTEIAKFLFHNSSKWDFDVIDRLTRPDMSSWRPQQNILKEYVFPTHSIREPLFMAGVWNFIEWITSNLTDDDKADVHVVPLSVAINGYPGVPNVDCLKFNTSAGHGYPGPKVKYVVFDEEYEQWSRFRKFDDAVIAEVERIVNLAFEGIRSHPIFTSQLKDEMVSWAKYLASKTRGFYMCPLPFLMAMRLFTTGLTRVMVRRRDVFCHAIGLNTHSAEWDLMFCEAEKIPGNNWLAGDFKGFDKILSILIQNGAKRVILEVCRYCGFNADEILALDTLLCDNVTAAVDFFGTLIMFLGGEVSGHQITAFFNSICNVLLHCYCWEVLARENELNSEGVSLRFFEVVFIRVLGDDVIVKVHPDYYWYNHTNIQRVFQSIGIEYTMADKNSASVPYISWEEVTFLKRTFRDHEAFPGKKVAPLDVNSIFKMVVYTQPSRDVSPEVQQAQAIASAYSEAFYHGRDFYLRFTAMIEAAPKSEELLARLEQYPPPTYEQCIERYMLADVYKGQETDPWGGILLESIDSKHSSYCHSQDSVAQSEWSVDYVGLITSGRPPKETRKSGVRLSSNQSPPSQKSKASSASTYRLGKQTQKITSGAYGDLAPASAEKAISKVLHNARRRKRDQEWYDAVAQSEIRPDTEGSTTQVQETYAFQHEPRSKVVDMSAENNPIARSMSMSQNLGSYLKRPILVHSFTWTEAMADGVQGSFNPWANFLSNGSVKEKLSGFGLVRGNLHVKFTVNGSPFYYGGLFAAYTPLSGYRTDTISNITNLALVQHSQKPHVWLNVQNTSSATMVLPFLYPYPFMETKLSSFNDMGRIDYVCIVPLKSANGVTGSAVDIQAFIWMEDVELSGPTNLPVAQSDIEYMPNGQISGPASAVAEAAGKLSEVPVIGKYAKATSEVSSMVGKFASLFGFTNVPNIRDVEPVQQRPFELSSSEISTPVSKLSLQPKQEIAIGSKQHGGGDEDELHISRFVGRQSFLVGSLWSTTAVPGDILFTSFVSPLVNQGDAAQGEIALPPMGYLSQLFQYWRGSIKFTFKMIRSKYHRGRIQIAWDRSASNINQGAVLSNMNTFTTVLDLDETDEVTIVVPYMQNRQFLQTTLLTGASNRLWSTASAPGSFILNDYANGVINVRVLNRLTAPEASSDVTLLVFVSAGDDFELAAPRTPGGLTSSSQIRTLSKLVTSVAQSDIQYEEDASEVQHSEIPTSTPIYDEVFGEKITSLRQLLHRSSMARSYSFGVNATSGLARYTFPLKHMPPSPGVWNNGNDIFKVALTDCYGNLCNQHPIPLIAACFIGYKGSVNVTANVHLGNAANLSGYVDKMYITRVPDAGVLAPSQRTQFVEQVNSATQAPNVYFQNRDRSGVEGMALTNTRTNASISANLPYYNNSGFFVSDLYKTYNNTDAFSGANQDWWYLSLTLPTSSSTGSFEHSLDVYYASGPDFDVIFFINTPTIYTRAWTLP